MKKIILILLLCAFAWADESCATGMGTVCMDARQKGNSVTLSAVNRETYEVVITVKAKLKNMTASEKLPFTRTLPGNFRGSILTFTAGEKGGWSWDYEFNWTPGSLEAKHDDSVIYELPFRGSRQVIQSFHGTYSHTGDFEYAVDFEMPVGTPIFAARGGTVAGARSTMDSGGTDRVYENRANFVMIRHPDGTLGSYDHLKKGGVAVSVGEVVTNGQLIGYSGNTGFSDGPHLHFMIFRALDGFKRQSFPMRFRAADGVVTPEQGKTYRSPVK